MVTQTCGCAETAPHVANRPASAKMIGRRRCVLIVPEHSTECGGMEARAVLVNTTIAMLRQVIGVLYTPGAPIGARIVGTFQGPVGMQNDGTSMAHYLDIGLGERRHIMPGREKAIDQVSVCAPFDHQAAVGGAPGS